MTIGSVLFGLFAAVIVYIILSTYIVALPVLLTGLVALIVFFAVANSGRWYN